jgi:formate-dependent nitrite reductase membrane component NrfD
MARREHEDALQAALERKDGRDIDPGIGALLGEGSLQRVRAPKDGDERRRYPVRRDADEATAGELGPTYYGLPVLKEPVWKWDIPAYFFTGGLAGASAVLGAAAQVAGGRGCGVLVRRCRLVAAGGAAVSAYFLIHDLGRPARFLNMLRVFRPTSPMNMGTWIFSGFSALATLAAAPHLTPLARPLLPAARLATYGAGVVGLPLVGYTGVLLSNTAVPVWQETRNTLPILFAFSGAVSAGALFDLWRTPAAGGEMAHRFGLVAKGAEFALSNALHREAALVPRVEQALRRGRGGALLMAARGLLLASAALDLLPGRRWQRARRAASGALGLAGTLAIRFGVVAAGRYSARDPEATFAMQRAGRGALEVARTQGVPAQMPSVPGVDATGKESVEHGAPPA